MAASVKLRNGAQMPAIGLGTFAANGDVMSQTLRSALECGYRHIDTAYIYLNEKEIGDELSEWLRSGRIKREDIYVTSKLPSIGNQREDVGRFIRKSLKNLQLDYLDLYLLHQPFAFKGKDDTDVTPADAKGNMILDQSTNLEEVYKGLEEQVDAGLTRAIGISNFNSKQVNRIMKIARVLPAVSQIEANVYMQQKPLKKLCSDYGIVSVAYGPLGAPYREQECCDEFPLLLKHPKVLQVAANHKRSPAQVLLRFLLQAGFVVIPKSATPSRIKENLQVFDFSLTESEMKELEKIDRGEKGRVLDFTGIFPGVTNHKEYPFHIPF